MAIQFFTKVLKPHIGKSLFNKWCLENLTSTCKKLQLSSTLTLYKNQSEMDQSPKRRPELQNCYMKA